MISHLAISLYFIFAPGYSFPLIFVDFCILGATTYNEFPAHFCFILKTVYRMRLLGRPMVS